MDFLKYLVLSLLSITALVILFLSAKAKKVLKFLILNSFIGISVFAILYFTKKYTGLNLGLNEYTLVGSSVFGIPAVIGLLVLNLII